MELRLFMIFSKHMKSRQEGRKRRIYGKVSLELLLIRGSKLFEIVFGMSLLICSVGKTSNQGTACYLTVNLSRYGVLHLQTAQ